jgi:uncharacterized spore protein YtfJ
MNVDEMVHGTHEAMNVRRVYGDPIEKDGLTLIPVASVTGGGGGGGDKDQNGGGGFGLSAKPSGAYVIKGGEVSFQPTVDVNRAILGGQIIAIFLILALRAILKRK